MVWFIWRRVAITCSDINILHKCHNMHTCFENDAFLFVEGNLLNELVQDFSASGL